jgi:RNA polymerase sigma factor (sigma-70 family)
VKDEKVFEKRVHGKKFFMTIQELEQCIALYGKDIYSFCRHLTREKDRADDLYQDTFLEAMKKITVIRYGENPKSYLLSIALRIWKNRIRKMAWRNRIAPTGSVDSLTEQPAAEEIDFAEKEDGYVSFATRDGENMNYYEVKDWSYTVGVEVWMDAGTDGTLEGTEARTITQNEDGTFTVKYYIPGVE